MDLCFYVLFQLPFLEHTSLVVISALGTNYTYRHLCSTRYLFTPGSREACEGKVPCRMTQHRNNAPILRGEKHDISLKVLPQAGSETARQAVTLSKLRALTIAPRPSPYIIQCYSLIHRGAPAWEEQAQ